MEDYCKAILNEPLYWGMTLNERLKYYKISAFSLALINDGKIDYTYCYGYKNRDILNLEKDNKIIENTVTENTLFQAGSISKPVFATAVMRLVQKGIVDLDKDISEYIDTSFYKTFDNQKHVITLRQLLSHTAGFNLHGFAGYQHGQLIPSLDQILKGEEPSNNLPLFLIKEPGKEWSYSGGGYLLAQKVICEVCGSDFETIVQNEVLQPFGMNDSTYQQPINEDKKYNIACGYDCYNLRLPEGCNVMPELAAAGLWTTPSDLASYGIEMMKAYDGKSQFISKETIDIMLTKVIPNIPTGLGLFIPDDNPNGYFDHCGDNRGYHSTMCFQAKGNKGYVAMINSDIGVGFYHELDATICKLMDM
jgi:CubicO group peptidase (beta-lactamase class C family)